MMEQENIRSNKETIYRMTSRKLGMKKVMMSYIVDIGEEYKKRKGVIMWGIRVNWYYFDLVEKIRKGHVRGKVERENEGRDKEKKTKK